MGGVLNLVINGLPSIPVSKKENLIKIKVLNLVINGLPSILKGDKNICLYNWFGVLNLVINGLPSILDKYNKETGVSYVF